MEGGSLAEVLEFRCCSARLDCAVHGLGFRVSILAGESPLPVFAPALISLHVPIAVYHARVWNIEYHSKGVVGFDIRGRGRAGFRFLGLGRDSQHFRTRTCRSPASTR